MKPKRRKPVKVEFNNKPWKVIFCESMEGIAGECAEGPRVIYLGEDLSDIDRFATALHEGLHACFPYINEECIGFAEDDIMKLFKTLKRNKYLRKTF